MAAAKLLDIFKPDTLIRCLSDDCYGSMLDNYIEWFPTKGEIYTVRQIEYCGDNIFMVYLQEGKVGHFGTTEIGITLEAFEFLQEPMNLTEIIEAQNFKP
jgi:hypothetical protein